MSLKLERRPSEPLVWPFAFLWENLTPLLDRPMASEACVPCWRLGSCSVFFWFAVEFEPRSEAASFVRRQACKRVRLRGGSSFVVEETEGRGNGGRVAPMCPNFLDENQSVEIPPVPERTMSRLTEKERNATLRVSRSQDRSKVLEKEDVEARF